MRKIENYSVISESSALPKIKVLLVDDQRFVRHSIANLIATVPNLKIVGMADSGRRAIELVESLQPHVVLIDLEMPEMDGVTATKIITRRFPKCKVIVLSAHEEGNYLQNALAAGATGYLLKGISANELGRAISSVYQGYSQLSPNLLEKVLTPKIEVLPDSETQAAELAATQEWSESTRETIETIPRVSLRALLYVLIALTALAIPWITFAKVEEIGTARGKLEPQGKVVRLDAPVSGTVVAIAAKEGERVVAGQSLLELESDLVNSELQQQQQKLQALQNRVDRLELIKNQQLLTLQTQKQQNQAQQFEKEALIEQAQAAIAASKSSHQMAKIRYRTAKEKVPRYRQAYEQGALSQDLLAEAKQTAQETQQSIVQTASEIAQAQSRYREQQRGYQSLVQASNLALSRLEEELNNTEAQIVTAKGEIAQTQSRLEGLRYQLQQRVVHAPITGTVYQLPIQKPGAVVQPGQMVAQIAPKNTPLILRARISSRESGFLAAGLPVKLKFDAYPFQDYGIIPGRLIWISPDSRIARTDVNSSSESSREQAEFYELEIELEQNYIQTSDRQINLVPGQTATAEIVIRQRRLADIFLQPFKSLQKGGIQM